MDRENIINYLQRCIDLTQRHPPGIGRPYVGALVLSRDNQIVGEGYRSFVSGTDLVYHAERMAIDKAGDRASGSTLFTTLEPCVRLSQGQLLKSCSELIVESGIETVVLGYADVSRALVGGEGINYLRNKGVVTIRCKGLASIIRRDLMCAEEMQRHAR